MSIAIMQFVPRRVGGRGAKSSVFRQLQETFECLRPALVVVSRFVDLNNCVHVVALSTGQIRQVQFAVDLNDCLNFHGTHRVTTNSCPDDSSDHDLGYIPDRGEDQAPRSLAATEAKLAASAQARRAAFERSETVIVARERAQIAANAAKRAESRSSTAADERTKLLSWIGGLLGLAGSGIAVARGLGRFVG